MSTPPKQVLLRGVLTCYSIFHARPEPAQITPPAARQASTKLFFLILAIAHFYLYDERPGCDKGTGTSG
jgi:hypothetical protein